MAITASQLLAVVNVVGAAEAEGQLLGVGAASDEAGGKLQKMALGGALLGGAALVAIGAKAVQMAGDFQSSTLTLVTGAGEIQSNLDMVRQGILKMAVDTGTSTSELVKGMYMIESAGFHGAAGLAVLQAAAEGAKVGNASLADVANGVTTIMVDYAKSHITAADATNILIAAVSLGKTHMADMSNAMATILPTASAVGVQMKDVAGAMATMTAEGTNAAAASTYLRQLLLALEAPASKGAASLKAIGLSAGEVSSEMKTSLPGALKMIMDHLAQTYQVGSPQYVEALKNIAGGSRQMQGILELTGTHLKTFGDNVNGITGALNQGKGSITGWALVQQTFNEKVASAREVVETLMIKIGTGLLPVIGKLVDGIGPLVNYISNFSQHANVLVPILAGLGVVLAAVVAPAVWSVAAGVIAATWPFLLIAVAVAGLVAIFMHFYQTSAPFKAFIDQLVGGLKQAWSVIVANFVPAMHAVGAAIQTYVMPILSQIGAFIVSNFMPVWKQLVDLWNNQLVPLGKQLMAALQPLMPLFIGLAEIVGVVLVVALGLVVGVIAAIIKGLAGFLSGLVIVIGGIVQVITGVIQVIAGIIRVIIDIVTLNFGDLGPALGQIWQGIINIFAGAWTIIAGLFLTAWFTISGIVVGFVQGIIGFFTGLYNDIVGHSIIPDMINGIINWFAQLPGRIWAFVLSLINYVKTGFLIMWNAAVTIVTQLVNSVIQWFSSLPGRVWAFVLNLINYVRVGFTIMWNAAVTIVTQLVNSVVQWFSSLPGRAISAVQSLQSRLAGFFGGLASQALTWGKNIIQGIIDGINNMLGAVGNAAQHVASTIANFLPHSPAKEGPLSKLNEFGPALVKGFSQGIIESTPMLRAAVTHMVQPLAVATVSPQYRLAPVAAASSGGTQSFSIPIYIGTDEIAEYMVDPVMGKATRKTRLRHGRRQF